MKACLSLLIALLVSSILPAQLPPLSPSGTIEQIVGTTSVTIEYTRPMVRGREIFGGLVPYGEIWQTGAGLSLISFDEDISFGGQPVPAGIYALLTIPNEREWTVILNSAADYSAFVEYDPAKNVAAVQVPVKKPGRFYEALSFELDLIPGSAQLYISWADVQVSVAINTPALDAAMAYVDNLLEAPLATEADAYFRATNYLLFNKRELKKALALTDLYRKLESGYYIYTIRRDIYVEMGDKPGAIRSNEEAIAAAKREFVGEPDRLLSILQTLQEEREKLDSM